MLPPADPRKYPRKVHAGRARSRHVERCRSRHAAVIPKAFSHESPRPALPPAKKTAAAHSATPAKEYCFVAFYKIGELADCFKHNSFKHDITDIVNTTVSTPRFVVGATEVFLVSC